jgi:hypothetical protein
MSRTEKFEVEITRERIGDLFTTCMESGYTPWVLGASIAPGTSSEARRVYAEGNAARRKDDKEDLVWWGHEGVWESDALTIELHYDREEDDELTGRGKIHLRMADLVKGLSAMAGNDGAHSLGMILNDDMDGPSADCWLQHVVFGKLVYG